MNRIWTIIKKEYITYFNSPVAYIFITVFLALSSWMYVRTMFFVNQADMRNYFNLVPWILLLLVPAVSMKMWAEEKKMGTLEVLLTWPVKDWEVVIGKFLAGFLFVLTSLAGSIILPIILSYIGSPDWGVIWGSYAGVALLSAAYLSIGLWASSITSNQVVAFIVGTIIIFALFIIGEQSILLFVPDFLSVFLKNLSLGTHYNSISRGVIDSRDLFYYFSIIGFFIYLNIKAVESRKGE